jgi:hypothetical protein
MYMAQDPKLVQIAERRKEKQEALRREYERVLFRHVLGCYTLIEQLGLKAVEMLDISKSGCSFRMRSEDGCYNVGEEIDFRFYFSNSTYLPTKIVIKRVHRIEERGIVYYQYGCVFDPALSSVGAIKKFVEFVQAYSENAKEDKGDRQVWYL